MKLTVLLTLLGALLGILVVGIPAGATVDGNGVEFLLVPRSISIPGTSLGFSPPLQRNDRGLTWPAQYRWGARTLVPIPADWDRTSESTVTVYFTPRTNATGVVSFFIRPTGREASGQLLSDPGSVSAPGVKVPADSFNALFSQSFIVPADRITDTDDVFHLYAIQRGGQDETFADDVTVFSVEITYMALEAGFVVP